MNAIKKIGTICTLVGALAGCSSQNATVPFAKKDNEKQVWLTRYERMGVSKDNEGNVIQHSIPHDRSGGTYLTETITTYFKDGKIEVFDLDRSQKKIYSPDGTVIFVDHLGNEYWIELKNR